jgi:arginase
VSWYLVGAPWDSSGTGRGEQQAPAALRAAGLADLVGLDLGDAATIVHGIHRDEATGVRALPETRADMELAILTGDGPRILTADLPPSRVALIGHRTDDLDPASAAELARVPAELLTIGAGAVRSDPAAVGERAAAWAAGLAIPMWLHVDLDVLDPSALPAVTYPQPGGPDLGQLAAVLRRLAASPALAGVSVADFRPDLDPDGTAARRVVGLLADAVLATR